MACEPGSHTAAGGRKKEIVRWVDTGKVTEEQGKIGLPGS